jgi:branched-chain amino acid transport system permease protein
MRSFDILTMVVLGGLGSISGSIIGAIIWVFVFAAFADFPEWRMIIYAVTLIALMIFRPQGLLGNKELSEKLLGFWRKGGLKRNAA